MTILLLAAIAGPAWAQDTIRATRGCFRPRPAAQCRWFVVTDAGFNYRLTNVIAGDERLLLSYGIGAQINHRNGRTALGGLVFGAIEGEIRGGLALRTRWWLGSRSAVDLTSGVHLFGEASGGSIAGSPMLAARLVPWDLVGLNARLDLLSIRNGCLEVPCQTRGDYSSSRFSLGAEAGGWLGTTGIIGTGVLIAILLITFAATP